MLQPSPDGQRSAILPHPHRSENLEVHRTFLPAKEQVTPVMCAHAYLAVTAAHAEKGALNPIGTGSSHSPWARSAVSWHT
ncbi:hypothetical protein GCM10022225_72110 [Plantactinospora mayteni]|uniref:Uncharacterized protein n=1 Tax=Plantactinospora mayteni TaxID=566021 RepID=A0ABQ4F177_9ACTN|nr:hypothetical protein Pma05_72370 [Plantactinospora mayteni]